MTTAAAIKPFLQAASAQATQLGRRLSQVDPGATAVKLVAAGLVVGTISIAVSDTRSPRNTDTLAEVIARISPIGVVSLGSATNERRTADAAVGSVSRDS